MANERKTEYRIKKITFIRKQCSVCGGTGKVEQKMGAIFKQVPCCHCMNGIAKIEEMTEIDLRQALNEMGIYKMIENTVNEIVTKTKG